MVVAGNKIFITLATRLYQVCKVARKLAKSNVGKIKSVPSSSSKLHQPREPFVAYKTDLWQQSCSGPHLRSWVSRLGRGLNSNIFLWPSSCTLVIVGFISHMSFSPTFFFLFLPTYMIIIIHFLVHAYLLLFSNSYVIYLTYKSFCPAAAFLLRIRYMNWPYTLSTARVPFISKLSS